MGSRKQRWLVAILIAALAITATTGAVYAYLSTTSGSVNNTFTAAPTHTIEIRETFPTDATNPTKENVKVDVGDPGYAVYVRVAIVITWKNGTNVHGTNPVAGEDYTITLNAGESNPWFQGSDGFYYLRTMVSSGETADLINTCHQLKDGPEGYTLHVEIIAQTIQAKGSTDADGIPAVESAWKTVTVDDDGMLTPVS